MVSFYFFFLQNVPKLINIGPTFILMFRILQVIIIQIDVKFHPLNQSCQQFVSLIYLNGQNYVQRVPALCAFWDLEKTVLDEFRVSGTVLWSPTNANYPTYTYISQKSW